MTSQDNKTTPAMTESTSGADRAMGQSRPPRSPRPSRRRAPLDWQRPLSSVYDSTAASPIYFGGE